MQCIQTFFEWIQDIIFQYKSLYVRNLKSSLTISQIKKRGHMHVNNKDLAEVSFCIHFYRFLLICEKKIVIKCWTLETGTCRTEHMIKVCLLKLWPHLEMFSITNASHHRHEIVWISSKYYIRNTIKEAVQGPLLCVVLYVLQWMVLGIWNHRQNMFMNFVIMQRSTYRLHIVRRALTA